MEFASSNAALTIEPGMLRAYFLHTDVRTSGSFSSNSSLLNQLQAVIVRTVLGNLHSLPSDCPTREKRGWMGDAQWSAENNVVNFNMGAVYDNWLRTIGDTQLVGCTHGSAATPPPAYCLKNPIAAARPAEHRYFQENTKRVLFFASSRS